MNFQEKYEKLLKKINFSHFKLAILGKILAVLAVGVLFSAKLLIYEYALLTIGLLISIMFMTKCILGWYEGHMLRGTCYTMGFLGLLFLVLLFGVRSSTIPYGQYLFVLGVILVLPALWDIIKK